MNDLISRQAALNELPHALWGKEWDEALAKAIIESLPTIDPVKHGRWVNEANCRVVFCSECGEEMLWASDYCPNCGAKMDGGEDE